MAHASNLANRPLALAAAACLACAGAPPPPKPPPERLNRWGRPLSQATKAPAWVDAIPESGRGKLLAVGRSGPTFWPQDALNNASEDARGKLALALSSHVESLEAEVESAGSVPGRPGGAREHRVQIDKEAADVVMQNSRIEATWTDESGERDEPGSVWALAVIDVAAVHGKAALSAASATWTAGSAAAPPSWLDQLPGSKAKIFAAGYSGPTFVAADALRYASDAAIDNLAASLRSHVQAYSLLVETQAGLSVDDFARTEDPDQAFKDLVKKTAKIEATWVDQRGLRAGDPPGAAWALASIEVRSTSGNYDAVKNADLGPALDRQGNAGAEPEAAAVHAIAAPAPAPAASPATGAAAAAVSAAAGDAAPARTAAPARGDAPAMGAAPATTAVPASATVR